MQPVKNFSISLVALIVLAGCATSEVTSRRSYTANEYIAKPNRIIVYDIAATPADVPPTAAITGHYRRHARPQSSKDIATGRKLGAMVAAKLVREILNMGMPAERAGRGVPPNIGDVVISGYFITIDAGSRGKRMMIGFGSGANTLKTFAEAYQVTPTGLKPIGSATVKAGGGKLPGMAAPLVIMGGIAGRPVMAAAVAGGINIAKELGPESLESAAKRSATQLAKIIRDGMRRRGWIR